MRMLSFIDAIPARNTVRRGESLNVLGGAANSGPGSGYQRLGKRRERMEGIDYAALCHCCGGTQASLFHAAPGSVFPRILG